MQNDAFLKLNRPVASADQINSAHTLHETMTTRPTLRPETGPRFQADSQCIELAALQEKFTTSESFVCICASVVLQCFHGGAVLLRLFFKSVVFSCTHLARLSDLASLLRGRPVGTFDRAGSAALNPASSGKMNNERRSETLHEGAFERGSVYLRSYW